MNRVRFAFRWLRWFFAMPNLLKLIRSGASSHSRQLILKRWRDSEPRP